MSDIADNSGVDARRPMDQTAFQDSRLQANFSVQFTYPVVFTSGVFNINNPLLASTLHNGEPAKRHKVLLFVDENVYRLHPELNEQWIAYTEHHAHHIASASDAIVVPGGESAKNDLHLQDSLCRHIETNQIDRHSFVLALGGGAMLDAVGLAAATAHRGVRLIRLPTTVLAQNDAGIGVKNGINHFGQKNWLGTFAPPHAVINDDQFLLTLNAEHRRSGMSEAVKVALIRDPEFFDWIEANVLALVNFRPHAVRYLIERCAQLHLQQITQAGDPFEKGSARPLDFGHWAAHRLEKITQHRLGHGDAVAMGIAIDSRYSSLSGSLKADELLRILHVLQSLGFPSYDSALDERDISGERSIMTGLDEFQRHLGGELCITLLDAIGTGREVNFIDRAILGEVLNAMRPAHLKCS